MDCAEILRASVCTEGLKNNISKILQTWCWKKIKKYNKIVKLHSTLLFDVTCQFHSSLKTFPLQSTHQQKKKKKNSLFALF